MLPAVEGGVRADRDRGGPALCLVAFRVEAGQPARVHAVRRDHGVRGGSRFAVGKPSARPRCWPRTTTPSTRCGRPRSTARPATSPRFEPLPDAAGGNRGARLPVLSRLPVLDFSEQRDTFGPEVVLLAQLGQQRHVAGGAVAEPEIVTHHDPSGVQPVREHG